MDPLLKIRQAIVIRIQDVIKKWFFNLDRRKLSILSDDMSDKQLADLKERLCFYVPELEKAEIEIYKKMPWGCLLHLQPVLLFGKAKMIPEWIKKIRIGIFDIDYRRNPMDGWEWCALARYCSELKPDIGKAKQRFKGAHEALKKKGLDKAYIFGTGPSLKKVFKRVWSDGYRIVCNTIVKDSDLWEYLDPHFIVAGDAIHHFGHTEFARAFRRDLAFRLSESSTLFVYPEQFHDIVRRELHAHEDRLIPIPVGQIRELNLNLCNNFVLPNLGNVLPLLLLPLACTLSKKVYLWAFDGRAPNDKLFWSHSENHNYPEFTQKLVDAHPAFFQYFVPMNNPEKYVKDVHGDTLDETLKSAEDKGWEFRMMHRSWTGTLQKRFQEEWTL